MGLLQQLGRLVQAQLSPNLNQPNLDPTDDPSLQVAETMAQLRNHRLQLRLAIAHAIASQRRCQRQQAQVEAWANHWRYQARLALEQSDEALAQQSLQRWQIHHKSAQRLQQQFQQQQNLTRQLQQTMADLEIKLQAGAAYADLLTARMQGLETTLALQQTLATLASETDQWQTVVADAQQLEAEASQISGQADRFEREWAIEEQFNHLRPDLGPQI
ncbi:MAG: PspA/IM30 family protein [Aphanocapsa sp. GSE-SYN-MK-11-07L]|jgi:phage shock protein A|nr:PspA/IM30 family protein [Aphanocapsa sp. GSE-SYN-MK-11-07L]